MTRHAACLALLLTLAPAARGQDVGYSGMVRIADDAYLTVNDRKSGIQPGDRLGILTVTAKGTTFHPLPVAHWLDPVEKEPNDLEAVCALPERPGEFLLGESGQYKKKYGRLFHVRVTRDADGWRAECLKAFKLPRAEPDDTGTTWPGDELEGMACRPGGKDVPTLVLGARGGQGRVGLQPARLVWGDLNLTTYTFTPRGTHALPPVPGFAGARGCADLHLVEIDRGWEVWSVAVRDDGDAGPFHSVVYRAGVLGTLKDGTWGFTAEARPSVRLHLHGLKVEALAAPPRCVPRAGFAVATDDENYGGVWRPLFPSP
ncbi:MAG TPA: hypothetical protein VD866_15390 [Urbifossiella sp.]|nr:hypothetical protein [Urbifossiella sp.]